MPAIEILMCQLAVTQKKDSLREWVELSEVNRQLDKIWSLLDGSPCDLVVFPETCYFEELDSVYAERSQGRIIVAGSAYNDQGINEAHVYQDGRHWALRKLFPSPVEVMELHHPNNRQADAVIREWEAEVAAGSWPDYFIELPGGKRAVVLTCMDYYRLGYYLANSTLLSPYLWGMVVPSSNGRQDIFLRLTEAIHDVNEKVYSLVVNSRNNSRPAGWDQGGSYIYGPITSNVKGRLAEAGQESSHNSAIYKLGDGAQALMMSLIAGDDVTFFARSKDFASNPTNVREFNLEEM